ncbi:histidinol dehydrogenase [Vulcanisaeta souniana JCM 11219]|uniref:Histidinol dehydrogenase n=1 Tax=Vulcanisaeta souniana JCM 11219 TaxID=1293586 RepID=A0ABN6SSQ6_9CREN|nr:histidinol dehydrogenase [Vulcanisaeta souniana JCM 11219]
MYLSTLWVSPLRLSRESLLGEFRRMRSLDKYVDAVRAIINDVRTRGDEAVIAYTERFDSVTLTKIEVDVDELRELASRVNKDVAQAIDEAYKSVEGFNRKLMPSDFEEEYCGLIRGVKWVPIDRVGIYVPRDYFSTLIMTGVIARVAGVGELVITTPPNKDGSISPEIAYVSLKLNARVFRVGGPQAIAAMAFGTASIPRVDKIVGPGNTYVQAAKYLVSQYVGIDGIEGPTELVVCADPAIDPGIVALDIMAQLEHNSAIAVLITWDERYLGIIEARLGNLNYVSTLVNGPRDCVYIVNELAPEHVTLWGLDNLISDVRNAGAVSVSTPSAMIDYVAGPSHVLPTESSARWRGALSVYDFIKPITYVKALSKDLAAELAKHGATLAIHEGFNNHAKSITEWLFTDKPNKVA